ncbi:PAS domain-containing protein [Hymenobacter taeanensis]|uniref:histidine kinase n=1 Tax=Hymenobacter taeanensis TaxID=2735321 RepID=A0A6M6BEE3_9BACT|nr:MULTISPECIES: PAS domain-containing protein [Hymenobacter]QJX45545.1 PAS domain-containing protein [Hymenobacter taeanensis]UOQ81206.1 PAS domain-containing protein [Hymenobacter sp. 5414T-23]
MPTSAFPVDYQHLFHSLPENFLLIAPNAEATIVDNTDSHVAVSLKSREEAIGKAFFEAYPATDEQSAAVIRESHEHVRRYLEPHTMPLIRYDLERPTEQGGGLEELYWEATHYPILNAQGELQFILQRTQNVTEQYRARLEAEQAQQALAESQDRMHFALESVPILVWTANLSGERDYFNTRWLQYTGRSMEEQLNGNWVHALHPDDVPRVQQQWQQSVTTGQPYQVEYRLRRADGQYRWVLMHGLPRFNAEGQITMWVGGGTDIHDQKKLVEELLETNEQQAALSDQSYQALQLAEQQRATFYNLFMQTPALICILRGPEHRFEFVNPEYQKMFPHRQLTGLTVAEALPEVIEQGFIDLLDKVYTTGETFNGKEHEIMLDRDGSGQLQRSYLNFTYQLFTEGDQKAGITVFAFDVTDLVLARQALENRGSDAQ